MAENKKSIEKLIKLKKNFVFNTSVLFISNLLSILLSTSIIFFIDISTTLKIVLVILTVCFLIANFCCTEMLYNYFDDKDN